MRFSITITGRSIAFLILLLLIPRIARGSTCQEDSDCPGYQPDAFCENVMCIDNECVAKPSPCMAFCNETLKACVECNTGLDCIEETLGKFEICDLQTHTCRACHEDWDCTTGSFCTGGLWVCYAGHCSVPPPSRWPCANLEACNETGHYCRECDYDADCGVWDFCTNPRYCDASVGRCQRDASIPDCASRGLLCSSPLERCVECETNLNCLQRSDSFCEPLNTCSSDGECSWNGAPACPNTNTSVRSCDEYRKICVDRYCVPGDDTLCNDGNECNGVETCSSTGKCLPAVNQTCLDEGTCDRDGLHCHDPRENLPCSTQADCNYSGFVCRIVSDADASVKACVRCRSDPVCSDGDPSNGEEICDRGSGKCKAGISPCANAPIDFEYNPLTGACDLDTGVLAVMSITRVNMSRPTLIMTSSSSASSQPIETMTITILDTESAADDNNSSSPTAPPTPRILGPLIGDNVFNPTFRWLFAAAVVIIIILVTVVMCSSGEHDNLSCRDCYKRRKHHKKKNSNDGQTGTARSAAAAAAAKMDAFANTGRMNEW